jgi:hypothetical protein
MLRGSARTHHAQGLGKTLSQFDLYPLLMLSRSWTNSCHYQKIFWDNFCNQVEQYLSNRETIIYYWGNPSPRPPGADGKGNVMVFGEQSVNIQMQ